MTSQETGIFTEKRRFMRVPAPKEATAIFNNEKGGIDRIHIRDLSLGGMLICDSNKGKKRSAGSVVNNIYLNIRVGDLDTGSKFYIFIGKGEIVRSFIDEASQAIYYGVEFFNNSSNDKYQLKNLIEKLSPNSYH